MPYQFLNPSTVLADLLGLEPNTNGFVHFYELGTTSEKDTWSDFEMTTANANPLQLDPDGRFPNAVWLDGDYTIAVADSLDAVIKTFDMRPEVASSLELPAHEAGKFLASDGANWILVDISEQLLPDPTGSTNHYLTTNGSGWQITPIPTPAAAPTPDIVVSDGANKSFRAGVSSDATKFLVQAGAGTAPATGQKGTSTAITFNVPYGQLLHVAVTTSAAAFTASGALVDNSVTGFTFGAAATGVTVNFNVSDDDSNSAWKISVPVAFTWIAFGFVEVT